MQGTLGDFPYLTVRLGCTMCNRRGRYKRAKLIARYGTQVALSELLMVESAQSQALPSPPSPPPHA
jgi:hypothetical protein